MPVVLLKFPLVAIFVWVVLNTDQEMGEFMSQSADRESLFAELNMLSRIALGRTSCFRLEAFKNSSCVELDILTPRSTWLAHRAWKA